MGRTWAREPASTIMHPPEVLEIIYQEHSYSATSMAGTLVNLDVPLEDVDLLSRLPWPLLANRIAVERERLDLPAVHPLLHWKLPPPPPDWLTPTVIVKIFDLALSQVDDEDPGDATELADGRELVLPA